MNGLPHPERNLHRYVRDLDACAAALGADLTKADELLSEMDAEFRSMQMEQITALKKELMPSCRQLEQILRTMAELMRNTLELYESVDDEIASAFRS